MNRVFFTGSIGLEWISVSFDSIGLDQTWFVFDAFTGFDFGLLGYVGRQ